MVEDWTRWERSDERHAWIKRWCQFWNEEDALEQILNEIQKKWSFNVSLTRRVWYRTAKRLSCHKLRRNCLHRWWWWRWCISYKRWSTSWWLCISISPIKASVEIPILIPVLLIAPATMILVMMITVLVPVRISLVVSTTMRLWCKAILLVLASRRRVVRGAFNKWTLRWWLRSSTISSGPRGAIPFKWSLARVVWCWIRVVRTAGLLWCRNRSTCSSLDQRHRESFSFLAQDKACHHA